MQPDFSESGKQIRYSIQDNLAQMNFFQVYESKYMYH